MKRLRARVLFAAILMASAIPGRAARVICYKATSQMWDATAGRAVPTSPEVLERLHGAFRLWEQASAGVLRLEYAGFSAPAFDGIAQLPNDGCIHAVLHGERNFHGELAHGRFIGTIPGDFKLGYFFVTRYPAALDATTLIHEIGHALGLPHAATPMSVMFSGARYGGRGAPSSLSEQDGADLRAKWAPGSPGLYTISGVIKSDREHPMASIFATSTEEGRIYSVRSDPMGNFSVALLKPGRYKLVAKPITVSMDMNPEALGGMRDSWFVSEGVSAPDPRSAAVLTLSDSAPAITGLSFKTLDIAPPAPQKPQPSNAQSFPTPSVRPAEAGGRPPVLRLSFDRDLNDEGPHHLRSAMSGDEVRLVPGVRGSAVFIGGTEDWLDLPLSSAILFDKGFSLELWYRRDDWKNPYKGGSGWQTIAALSGDASLSITAPGCPLHKPWALQGDVDGGSASSYVFSTPDLPARKWTHAALVYDPTDRTLTLYLDGTRVDQAKGVPKPDFKLRKLRLGTWHKANQAFRGEIDEVEVYDFPRSSEAIALAAGRPA